MTRPEHPLIAADRSNACPNLIGEGLEAEPAVCCGKRTRDGCLGTVRLLNGEKLLNGFLISSVEEVFVSIERNEAHGCNAIPARDVEPVDRVEEEQGSYLFVQIAALGTKCFKGMAFLKEELERCGRTVRIECLVAQRGILCGDDRTEGTHAEVLSPI